MKRNEGSVDRILRVLLGVAMLAALFLVDGDARWFGLIGLVPLVTGLAGYCPLYALFGLSTCPVKATREAFAQT